MTNHNTPSNEQILKFIDLQKRYSILKLDADRLSREAHNLRLEAKRSQSPSHKEQLLALAKQKEEKAGKTLQNYNKRCQAAFRPSIFHRFFGTLFARKEK